MRSWFTALVLLVPAAQGVLLEDPVGDLRHWWLGQEATLVDSPYVDLVSLDIQETEDAFDFHLTVAAPDPGPRPNDYYAFYVWLMHGTQQYRMAIGQIHTVPLVPSGTFHVSLVRVHADGAERVWGSSVMSEAATFSWSVGRYLFLDEVGATPALGRAFEDIHVTTYGGVVLAPGVIGEPTWRRSDRMPDEGAAQLPIVYGLTQHGATLASREPFRASNGEAGRFYVRVNLTSDLDGQDFVLPAAEVPGGWSVRLPFDEVSLDAGEHVAFSVELTVPFAHAHGTTTAFRLHADSQDAHAVMKLGIHYVDPPQPSGHHPRIFIHSFGEEGSNPICRLDSRDVRNGGYVNTAEDDDADSKASVEPNPGSIVTVHPPSDGFSATWTLPLFPGLRMGLNVTDDRTPFLLRFDTPIEHQDAYIDGSVQARGPDGWTTIATLSSPTATLPSGEASIEGVVHGLEGVMEYSEVAGMQVQITLHSAASSAYIAAAAPYLLPGSWIGLPLAEYEESIADSAGFVQATVVPDGLAMPEEAQPPGKKSPGVPALLVVVFALALKRRIT